MRILILIPADNTVRNFVDTGAFGQLDQGETFYLSSSRGVSHEAARARLSRLPTYLGDVDDPRVEARWPYKRLRLILLAATRRRSRTMRHKLGMLPWRQRLLYKVAALPLLRHAATRILEARAGSSEELRQAMVALDPDLLIAPSNGYDPIVWDGLKSARELGIPSVALIASWDNLSSKGIFPVQPNYVGVWGEQSVEQAEQIHSIPPDRVRSLGAPHFDHYFRYEAGSGASPFEFKYALFAGCFAPFDELSALERLERLIERERLALKVVYRPHPHRVPRNVPDHVEEGRFRHVIVDPQVRELYEASSNEAQNWGGANRKRLKPLLPSLDYYPALLDHAEFVVCPLSTMMVEAAIFERSVAVIAYEDGIHVNSPASVVDYDHFDGIDRIDGFHLCREPEALDEAFLALARGQWRPAASLREQIRWWLHFDSQPYSHLLQEWIAEIGAREGLPAAQTAQGAARSVSRVAS